VNRRAIRLQALDRRLSDRDRHLVQEVVRLRFVTAGQLERLAFHAIEAPVTRARRARRQLARLVELDLLWRLERRVGGVRAGSTGYVYGATAEARRLDAWLRAEPISRAQVAHEPGATFVEHSVACCELFVRLTEADRADDLELLEHQAEPTCWRHFLGPVGGVRHLRPDAFVRVGLGEWEQLAFIELDRGSEGSAAIARKLELYVAYWRSGIEQHQHGVFPKVVWLTTTDRGVRVLRREIARLPNDAQVIFAVTEFERALDELRGEGGDPTAMSSVGGSS
jgi:hypothetical protein